MSIRPQIVPLALLIFVIGISSAAAGGERQPFKITSTLDGNRVLPLRLHWLAYPKLPAAKISRVDFLIDGKVCWTERNAPYGYGGGESRHSGFLITTWLKVGRHTFTARAVDSAGRTATNVVIARVLPAPKPPAALAGAGSRTVTPDDIKKSGPGPPPPPGRWKLIFDRVGAWHIDPDNGGVVNQYTARSSVIDVFAPITMAPKGVGVSKFGAHGFGCCDCNEAGPFGSYEWSVSGDELTLKAKKEGCRNRRAVWEGIWTRGR
jgi:hypothetical protein